MPSVHKTSFNKKNQKKFREYIANDFVLTNLQIGDFLPFMGHSGKPESTDRLKIV